MRVTKHEHATLRIEKGEETLVIDPGNFTRQLHGLHGVVGVVITHEHPDHWTPAHLDAIRAAFPGVPVYSTPAVAAAAEGVTEVAPGDVVEAGSFRLEFFGGTHNEIHSSVPLVDNVGVLVDDAFYYPGDSYAVPDGHPVELLAAPLSAPWLKIGEAMDFVLATAPRRAFGTHDALLSPAGIGAHRARLQWATEQGGGEFFALEAGDDIEI
ncbi:MAG: MBL fold metallo-hydrolase [Microbacterium sp.]